MKNKLNYIFLLLLFISGIVSLFLFIENKKAQMDPKPVAIWYVPHPDDETLFMGGSIKKYDLNGYRNILILFTKGGSSLAIHKINSKLTNKLNQLDFEEARVNEFLAAASHLGINKEDIIIYNFPDGKLKEYQKEIYQIILKMNERYPGAVHNSMSYHDSHIDHRTIGETLLRTYNEHKIVDINYYLANVDNKLIGSYVQFNKDMNTAKIWALQEYKYYNVEEKRYAVGYASVPNVINNQLKNPREKVHKPGD